MSKYDFEIFRLEDRVLFEAAAAAEIIEAVNGAQDDPNANTSAGDREAQEQQNAVKNAPPEDPVAAMDNGGMQNDVDPADIDGAVDALIEGIMPAGDEVELVVVNSTVQDIDAIAGKLHSNQQLLVLDAGNGLKQLNDFLDTTDVKFSAIHLLSHGKEGSLRINGESIDADNFDADSWSDIGEHLTESGDILLYGCDVAASGAGVSLVQMISEASGCDVAASDDATGVSGDWLLEYQCGTVESSALDIADFAYDLAPTELTVDIADDLIDDTDGFTSLREAIEEAVSNGGEYLINFASGISNITLNNVLAFDVDEVLELTIDGDVDDDGLADVTISGDDASQIMNFVLNEDFTLNLENLTLTSANGTSQQGGAVVIDSLDCDAALALNNVSIVNSVADEAAAVRIAAVNVDFEMVNSTIFGNSAEAGGGGAMVLSADEMLTVDIVNSTITGNEDMASLGALEFSGITDAEINVINSIIAGNGDIDIMLHSHTAADALTMSHSIYGSVYDSSYDEAAVAGSSNIQLADVSTIFETGALDSDGRTVAIKNDSVAAYGGTLVNSTDFSATDDPAEAILTDQNGAARDKVLTQLGVAEFAIGAVVPATTYLKVTPVDKSVIYDGNTHQASEFVYQTASGATVGTLPAATQLSAESTFTASANVGTYEVTTNSTVVTYNGTDVSSTYYFDWQTGEITITAKTLTVTAHDQSVRYGGTADLSAYSVTGWVAGDETALGNLVIVDPVFIAGYLATGEYVLGGSELVTPANYAIDFKAGTLTVYGKMPSPGNEDTFGPGVQNPGYSGTMAALRGSIYAGNYGGAYTLGYDNPDAMTYAGLVSHEINARLTAPALTVEALRVAVDAMPRSEGIAIDDLEFSSYDGYTLPGIIVDADEIPEEVMLWDKRD